MTIRRWLGAVALAVVGLGSGCQAWCSRHYPCPQPAAYAYPPPAAPQCQCVPVCCQPTSGYPAPAAAPTWNQPRPVGCPPCQ